MNKKVSTFFIKLCYILIEGTKIRIIVLDNITVATVIHRTYRVRMYVVATAQGVGSESFNVDGNTVTF